jgi:hypothetical protein
LETTDVVKEFELETSGLPCKGPAYLTVMFGLLSEIIIGSEIRVVTFTCLYLRNWVIAWVI